MAFIRTDISEEFTASIIRVTRTGELGITLAVCQLLVTANVDPSSPILVTLMMETLSSSDTSVLTRAHLNDWIRYIKFMNSRFTPAMDYLM
jgi:hypothetical protein